MAVAEELQIIIDAKVNQAVGDLKRVQKQSGKTAKSSKDMAKSMVKTGLAAGAAALSIGKIVSVMRESVQLYGVQVQAEQKLGAAIRATGGDVDELLPKYKDLASEIQNVTTEGDESTLALIQQAKSMGVADDQIEEATKGAIGLSKALGIGTQQAIKGVANAMQGEFQTLQRYIPALRSANSDSEKMAIVQEAMADGFDVAKAEADSAFGSMEQLGNATGDLQETLGRAVAEGIQPFVTGLTDWISKLTAARTEILDLRAILLKQASGETVSLQEQIKLQQSKVNKLQSQIELQSKVQGGEDSILGSFKASTEELDAQLRSAEAMLGNLQRRKASQEELNDAEEDSTANGQDAINHLENLQDAYAKTNEGRVAAIEEQIAYFETFKQGPMALAVLENLRAKLEELTEQEKEATFEIDETVRGALEARSEAYNSYYARVQEASNAAAEREKANIEELEGKYMGLAQAYSNAFSSAIEVLKDTGDAGKAAWELIKETAKESIALVLEGLAKQAVAQAAIAAAGFNFASAAAYTGAAAAALGAASAVRSFRSGGIINEEVVGVGTRTGQPYQFGEAGAEKITPTSGGQSDMMRVVINLDGRTISNFVTKATRERQILVDAGAVV